MCAHSPKGGGGAEVGGGGLGLVSRGGGGGTQSMNVDNICGTYAPPPPSWDFTASKTSICIITTPIFG